MSTTTCMSKVKKAWWVKPHITYILSGNSFARSFLIQKKTSLKQSAALNIYLLTNGINVSTTDFVWSCNICYQWVKDIFFVCCTWLLVQHQHFQKIIFQWQARHVFQSCHILYISFLKVAKRYKSVLEGYVRLENCLSWNLCKTFSLKTYSIFYTHPLRLKILIYSWTPLFRSPKENGTKVRNSGVSK